MTQEEIQKLLDEFGQSEIALTPQWKIDNADMLRNQASEAGKLGGVANSKKPKNRKILRQNGLNWHHKISLPGSPRGCKKGINNGKSKISEEKAQQILDDGERIRKEMYPKKQGLYPKVHQLHKDVSFVIVKKICSRKTWKHLTPKK